MFSWVEDVTYSSVNTVKNGPNLVTKKQGTKYTEAIDNALFYCRRWQLSQWTLTVDSTPVPGVIFWMHELNWIFIHTKWCTYKNGSVPRTLYLYSSICDPVHMGDQMTVLFRQIHQQPMLAGQDYQEPCQIHYIQLRNNHIDDVETQISESENNSLAQFATDSLSILTLHLHRVQS